MTQQINLLMQFFPLKVITGKVNLSSMHTNFAPIELENVLDMWLFLIFLCSSSYELVLFKTNSVSAYTLNGIGTCFS